MSFAFSRLQLRPLKWRCKKITLLCLFEQKRQAQMQEQFLIQQRQLQQQMDAEAQSQALLMTLLAKMNKS